ncbi:MAG: hypothetical protein KAT58_03135 [candidate division Zixibacteria bacterium]|nr:hypothetical protein [candidate division Zixibacteria bacterium]
MIQKQNRHIPDYRINAFLLFQLTFFLLVLFSPQHLFAGNYPKDGVFKRLPDSRDNWYFIDHHNWEIKAPDKWTHMMGSLGSSLLFSRVMNKYAAAALVLSFGLYKEYDDAFREGWSYRDIIADLLGVTSSLVSSDKYSLICDYNQQEVMLKLTISIR